MDVRSRYKEVSETDVVREYEASASEATPYGRAKWGSEASMINRFHFVLHTLPMEQIDSWLDIGCGEADFFALAEEKGYRFKRLVGHDITPSMIDKARMKTFASPAEFHLGNLDQVETYEDGFDLVTLLGVLQQCGMRPAHALRAASLAVKPGGLLFLTTKHIGWEEFTSERLQPDPSHSWFSEEELTEAVTLSGLTLVTLGGFLPRENEVVPPERSHMVYLLAKKEPGGSK